MILPLSSLSTETGLTIFIGTTYVNPGILYIPTACVAIWPFFPDHSSKITRSAAAQLVWRRDSAADFEHCAGHSYLRQNCLPGMHWVALLWTFQMNSYTLTHWSNFPSISIPLAVPPVPSVSSAVKPCCRCWMSHGTFLFCSTPLTESVTTLLPDNDTIVSVYLSFVRLQAVRMNSVETHNISVYFTGADFQYIFI